MDALTSALPDIPDPWLWQNLAEHMSQLVWMADGTGHPFWFNRRCSELIGLSNEELQGEGWLGAIHPDDAPRVGEEWFAAIAARKPYQSSYRLRAKDGSYRHFLARAVPHHDEEGAVRYWFGTSTDVTEQHEAEVEARRSAERLQRAVRMAGMFDWETDRDGRIHWGANAAELLGLDPADLPGKAGDSLFFVADEEKALVRGEFERAIAAKRPACSLAVKGRDGRHWRAECRITYAADGSVEQIDGVTRDVTEEVTQREQLQLSEAQFRSTADTVPGMLFVSDGRGNNLYVNDYYRSYAGVEKTDVLGKGWASIIHPDDLPSVRQALGVAVSEGATVSLEYRIRRKDGAWRWHSSRATPIVDDSRDIVRWVGISLDIDDRRTAEEQARLAADEIAATYATAPIGLVVVDRDLRYVRVNDRLAEMSGLPAADHVGKTLAEVLPDISDRIEQAVRRCLAGEEVWGFETSGETDAAPGVVRTWRENWLPLRDAQGTIVGAAGSVEEITLEKEVEERFRTIFNSAAVGIGRVAPEGPFLEINDRFCDILGRSREEILAGGWRDITHPDDLSPDAELVAKALAGEIDDYTIEKRYIGKDGGDIWVNLTVSAERNPDGSVKFFISVVEDISERKRTEEALRRSEQRYRGLFDTIDEGFCIIRFVDGPHGPLSDYVHVEANPAYTRNAGIPDVVGQYVRAMVPDEADSWVERYREVLLTGQPIRFEQELKATQRLLDLAAFRVGSVEDRLVAVLFRDRSEEYRARNALAVSEERYRALFESMDQGFCIIRVSFDEAGKPTDYRFSEINPAFTRQTGLPETILGQSMREAVPDLEQIWFDRYGRVARTGQHERFVDYAEPLGRWFEVYAFPIGAPSESNVAILFTDVTERVQQEEELRRSEGELRLRLDAIPQMVWSTLPDGYHDFYNNRWYEFTGVPQGSTDGAEWNGMFHPEDQPRAWERWNHSLASGEPYEIEYRLRHHSGAYRWVLGRALPIRDEAGTIVRWMGTCTDIDDRIEAERALRDSEARLRAILEAVPVGLMFADREGRLTGSNEQILRFLGSDRLKRSSIDAYKEDFVAFHADGRQVESEEYPMARALRGEDRPELECQVQRADGSRRWLRHVAAPIRDEDGTVTGGVVASIDIDRERKLTLGLEREVEKVIAEREAAQEALRQSQKLEAMGQLTGGVAHDFNNLLTPIIGSLDLLQRKQVLDERTGRLVEGALTSAERARVLVQRLLAFARRQPLQATAVDIRRIVAEMSELIDSTSGPRVRVVTDAPDQLPPALADGNQLEMALLNLSVNARDAMPDGGTLTIATRLERPGSGARLGLPDKQHVVLSVSDTGTGMDEETRRRAIEPFFSTKGIGKGTGLGLSMVHGLAAQLGGGLDIRSRPGMGTTIELWLPVARGKVASGQNDSTEAETSGAGTALLVDDEELVRESTAGMLGDLGYRVVEANSGEAALALLDDGLVPDLLVTDQLMPGLSGTDLAVRLRDRQADLPVLIVSGYADLESLSPSFPHLSKPFRQAELAAALDKALNAQPIKG